VAEPKNHTVAEFLTAVKPKLEKLATDIRAMRERELAKHGKPCEVCAELKCEHKLQKNAVQGYPQSTPGSGLPSPGPQSGGTQPMGMSEKMKKDAGGLSDVGTMSKKASEMNTTPHLSDAKPGRDFTKHSSSMAATTPAAPRPQTSVTQANKEMGGFQSLAHSPTAMPAAGGPSLVHGSGLGRKPIAQMGRKVTVGGVGTPHGSASGVIANAKSEKNPGSASKYGTGGPGHASQKNMPSALKANMAPTAKAEKEMKRLVPAPEKAVPGAKMPEAGDSVDAKKTGAGGQIKANPLRKDAMSAQRAPEGAGVPGKQPVGMGGGDAHKIAGGARNIPAPRVGPGTKTPPAPGQPSSVDVDVSAFDKGPAKPNEKFGALKAAGRQEVSRVMTANHEAGKNPNAPAGGGQQATDAANLKQDLRGGGVGWLRNLLSRLNPSPTAAELGDKGLLPKQKGSLTSARFHGALPLQRGEAPMSKAALALSKMGSCALCKEAEHPGMCKGLSGVNHNRTMLSVSTKGKKSR